MDKIDLTSREYLNALETEALQRSQCKGTNLMWASVYKRLAEVACELDAYIARSSGCSVILPKETEE